MRGLVGMVMLAVLASWVSGPPHAGQDVPPRYGRSSTAHAQLERKIGQMLLVGFRGMSVDDAGLVGEQV
ncbi:MAG: hypothetical protein M3143_04860, partial [Actinomycetota bacterium]|nr:hypothetical protein [Actinomycetota bacterium]